LTMSFTDVVVKVSQMSGSVVLNTPIDGDETIARVKSLVTKAFNKAVSTPRVNLLLDTEVLADDQKISSLATENRLDVTLILRDRSADGCVKLNFPWKCKSASNGATTFVYDEDVSTEEVLSAGCLVRAGYTNIITHTLVLHSQSQSYSYTEMDLGMNGISASGTWEYDAVEEVLWLEGGAEGETYSPSARLMHDRPPLVRLGTYGAWIWNVNNTPQDSGIKRHSCCMRLHLPFFSPLLA